MTVSINGTPVATAYQSFTAPSTATINLPTGITSGEALIIVVLGSDPNKALTISGWTSDIDENAAGEGRYQIFTKTATGSEGSTVEVGTAAGTTEITTIAFRTDADTTDIIPNTNNHGFGVTANSTSISIAASEITGMTSGNAAVTCLFAEANRTVSTYDSDFESEILQENGTNSVMCYLDTDAGTANPQYDFTLNSAYPARYIVFELANGASIAPQVTHIRNMMQNA